MKNINKHTLYILLILGAFFTTNTTAQTYYVDALKGNNNNSGTNAAQAWATIQKAADNVEGGSTVIIAGGIYNEKVAITSRCSGTANKPTVFKNKDGETVIVDGQIGNSNANIVRWLGQFEVKGAQYITVKGIKVQNVNWYALRAEGSGTGNITFDSCSTFNSGASGIYINTCTNITLTRNKVLKACQVTAREAGTNNGTQECITLTRTSEFKVNNNEIGESTVGGSVGGEGIDIKGASFNGEVSNNYIHDILVLGIYIDAGSGEEYNIRVFSNRLYRTYGLGVAGELGGHAHEIYFYNNVVKESKSSGLVFQETGNGKFTNVYVVNNTFYNCAESGFAGDVGSYTRNTGNTNNVIKNNIFYNKLSNSRFSIWHNYPAGHVIGNNLYFDFKPSNNSTLSFNNANLTVADILLDPQFKDAAKDDFSLLPTSPAINKGVPITLPNSTTLLYTTDLRGTPKTTTNWDMGAYEYTASTSIKRGGEEDNVKIYPNPAQGYVILQDIAPNAHIEMYDVLGKKVLTQKAGESRVKIDISTLNKGIYFFQVMNTDKRVQIGKLIKE